MQIKSSEKKNKFILERRHKECANKLKGPHSGTVKIMKYYFKENDNESLYVRRENGYEYLMRIDSFLSELDAKEREDYDDFDIQLLKFLQENQLWVER